MLLKSINLFVVGIIFVSGMAVTERMMNRIIIVNMVEEQIACIGGCTLMKH